MKGMKIFMKKVVIAMILVICIVATIFTVLTINGRASREEELAQSLGAAVESSLKEAFLEKNYNIMNTDEFVGDFLQYMAIRLNSNSDITVNVVGIDYEKGMVTIEITGTYTHPNGKAGAVSVQKTVLLEQSEKKIDEFYNVTYYVDKEIYMKSVLKGGDVLMEPDTAGILGFQYWGTQEGMEIPIRNESGELICVSSDLDLYAITE